MTAGLGGETCSVRVANIYATRWRYRGDGAEELQKHMNLGRLAKFYDVYRDQLPKMLPLPRDGDGDGDGDGALAIALADDVDGLELGDASVQLFTLPSDQVVLAVTLEFTTGRLAAGKDARPITSVLEQCIEEKLLIAATALDDYVHKLPIKGLSRESSTDLPALLPERHQLVFIAKGGVLGNIPTPDVIDEIVYREEPPYREEFTVAKRPEQLNLRIPADPQGLQVTLGVVTPYVSLIYGHERFVEDSIFLSTVQAVGTAARFRQIWLDAYTQVRRFRDERQQHLLGQQIRDDLEDLADSLGNLEFDLTFSVEFPLMRIESFHSALYEAMDLSVQAQALSQMFTQLAGSLRSEITAIDIREQRKDEGRQKWNSFAAAILSLVGVSVGFVVTFLGINALQVSDAVSMWDSRYAAMYFVASLFALTPVLMIVFPYVRDWSRARGDMRAVWLGLGVAAVGGVYEAWTGFPHTVIAGVVVAVADFFIVLGLLVALEWLARKLRKGRSRAA
jgi:hypothetical protein